MDTVLLIDKPKEWTSFDVVAKVRSILRSQQPQVTSSQSDIQVTGDLRRETKGPKIRVGHAGTLDPLATGLLIVLVGKATKRQDEFMKQDKVYEVSMKLGQTSTTADEEGEKTVVSDVQPSLEEVEKAINSFVGVIQQVPPAFSAIKIDGQRAYKLARAGKEVKIEPRTVTIYSIDKLTYNYPDITFTSKVSSGTYIRSLVTDIGELLETGAYMTDLRRTSIGNFNISKAHAIEIITPELITTPVG